MTVVSARYLGAFTKVSRDQDYVWVAAEGAAPDEAAATLGRLVCSWHQETAGAKTVAIALERSAARVALAGTLTGIGSDGRKTTRVDVYEVAQPGGAAEWLALAGEADAAIARWRGIGEIPFLPPSSRAPAPAGDNQAAVAAILSHLDGDSPWIRVATLGAAVGVFDALFPHEPDLVVVANGEPRDTGAWSTPLLLARLPANARPNHALESPAETELSSLWSVAFEAHRRRALWRVKRHRGLLGDVVPSLVEAKWLLHHGLTVLELWPLPTDVCAALFGERVWRDREAQFLLNSHLPLDASLAPCIAAALAHQPSQLGLFVQAFGKGHPAATQLLSGEAAALAEAFRNKTACPSFGDDELEQLGVAGIIETLPEDALFSAVMQTGHPTLWAEVIRRETVPDRAHLIQALALSSEPLDLSRLPALNGLATPLLHALPAPPLRAAAPLLSALVSDADAIVSRIAQRADFGEAWRTALTAGTDEDARTWLRGRIQAGTISREGALARMIVAAGEPIEHARRWLELIPDLGLPADGLFAAWLNGAPPPAGAMPDEAALWGRLLEGGTITVAAIIQQASRSVSHLRWLIHAPLPPAQLALLIPGFVAAPRLPLQDWDPRLSNLLANAVSTGTIWMTPGLIADLPALRWLSDTLAATTVGGTLSVMAGHLEHGTPLDEASLGRMLPALDEPTRIRQTALRWAALQADNRRADGYLRAMVRHAEVRDWLLRRLDPFAPPGLEPTSPMSTAVVIALFPLLSAAELLRFALLAEGPTREWELIARHLRALSHGALLPLYTEPILNRIRLARPELHAALDRLNPNPPTGA